MSKDKALIHDLSTSTSFGRLSLRGKVFWPMLLTKADDQGRGIAEPDALKWKVCPNVEEITIDDIPDILAEMSDTRVSLLHLYEDSRGRKLYQIIRWWQPEIGSGSYLQWARASEYEAPDGWTDRVRIQPGRGKNQIIENWDHPGGFAVGEAAQPDDKPAQDKAGLPPINKGTYEPTPIIQPNITQPNPTKETNGADAPTNLDDWLSFVGNAKNKPAAVRFQVDTLFPNWKPPPDYGYIGRAIRTVKGETRLTQLLWQAAGQRITGDPLAYAMGIAKGQKTRDGPTQNIPELEAYQ